MGRLVPGSAVAALVAAAVTAMTAAAGAEQQMLEAAAGAGKGTGSMTTLGGRRRLGRWRLSRGGLGPLRVGASVVAIERRTGRRMNFVYATGDCAIWNLRGVRGLSFLLTSGRLAVVYVSRGGGWRTTLGVRRRDTERKVRRRYPRVRTSPHAYDPDGSYLTVPGKRRRIVFEVSGSGRVTLMRAGRTPEVGYVEGCA